MVDLPRLGGTLVAFALGLGIGAHALDEVNDRPLGTSFSAVTLWVLGVASFVGVAAVAAVGVVVISPWVLAWAAAGIALAVGYAFEWPAWLHTEWGFALAWGAFPVLAGFWAQAETVEPSALVVAAAAALLSRAQRTLSTPARHVRRQVNRAEVILDDATWDRDRLLKTWEDPLQLLSWAVLVMAVGLVLARL
ncbi:MAG: hypothetical protein IH943_12895, partial [Acidobacteria bacterium]|nr:hypothetical protein [Acidobacteriota bacterium]